MKAKVISYLFITKTHWFTVYVFHEKVWWELKLNLGLASYEVGCYIDSTEATYSLMSFSESLCPGIVVCGQNGGDIPQLCLCKWCHHFKMFPLVFWGRSVRNWQWSHSSSAFSWIQLNLCDADPVQEFLLVGPHRNISKMFNIS